MMVGSVIGFGGGLLAAVLARRLVVRRTATRRAARDPRAAVRAIERQTIRAMLEAEWETQVQQFLHGAGSHE